MSTRGIYGFRKSGHDKLTYNHCDSYPEGLGAVVVEFIRNTPIEELNAIFDRIVMIDGDCEPTDEQIEECTPWTDLRVSAQSTKDWYCLLRKAQFNPNAFKEGLRYMVEDQDFIKDSLFCEYGYIINLDDNTLEFYVGFQHQPQKGNRYGEAQTNEGYYPCQLKLTFPLDAIPEDAVAIMDGSDDENWLEKKCPYCGSPPFDFLGEIEAHKHYLCDMPDCDGFFYAECSNTECSFITTGKTEEEAKANWILAVKEEGTS